MKTRYILSISLFLPLLTGCGRQEEDFTQINGTALRIQLDDSETRVSFDGSGNLTWVEGDEIAVWTGAGYEKATVTETSSSLVGVVHMSEAGFADRLYYAIYPYEARNATYYGNTDLAVSLPASYDIAGQLSSSPAKVPMVAVNKSVDNLLRFHQMGALLRVTCNKVPAETKTIRVTFDQPVTGDFLVNAPATTIPTITTADAIGNNTHTVSFTVAASNSGLAAATNGIVLNVPLPCGTYHSVTVSACNNSGTVLLEGGSVTAHTFNRRHGLKLSPFGNASASYVCTGMNPTATISPSGGSVSLASSLKSYSGTSTAEAFILQYSTDDGVSWTDGLPDWISGTVNYSGGSAGQAISVTVAEQICTTEDTYRKNMLSKERYAGVKDLSTINVATGATISRTTANCYVVDRPGDYKFPLVYGNGVYNGSVNQLAFRGSTDGTNAGVRPEAGTAGYLGWFQNHLDNNITSPYLATQLSTLTPFSAALLWTDVPGLIDPSSVAVTGSGEDTYITFSVPSQSIAQGNAVIAVKDKNGKIAWSWQIWVTSLDLSGVKDVSNGLKMMPVSIGWCYAQSLKYEGRSCQIRACQTGSGVVSQPVVVTQMESIVPSAHGTTTYFQWGRKDPFLGADVLNSFYTIKSAYYYSDQPSENIKTEKVSIGNSIQNPCVYYAYSGSDPSDWCNKTYNNTWNSAYNGQNYKDDMTTVKTIYDPSPVGFKLPTRTAFAGFVKGTNFVLVSPATNTTPTGGTYTPSSLFFPCSGARNSSLDVGGYNLNAVNYASYWTCVPINTNNSSYSKDGCAGFPFRIYSGNIELDRLGEWRIDGKPIFPIVGLL